MKRVLACVVLFVGGSGLWGGLYTLITNFVFPGRQSAGAFIQAGIVLAMATGVTVLGSRLWDRWMPALAAVLALLGLTGMRTDMTGDPTLSALSARAFKIDGVILLAAAIALYLIDRRRRTGH